jgi:CubicO group peptidase (beta-lactamase class C family)
MTKPLTAVAIMMLYEEGQFQLDDPITRYLPDFAGQRVFTGGGYGAVMTEPSMRDITFRDLLTHTSGLTYGFMQATPVDAIYRAQKLELPGSVEQQRVVARLEGAAYCATRHGMELLNLERCAGPFSRCHLWPAFR